jgi:Na+/H+ antiporter NhaC
VHHVGFTVLMIYTLFAIATTVFGFRSMRGARSLTRNSSYNWDRRMCSLWSAGWGWRNSSAASVWTNVTLQLVLRIKHRAMKQSVTKRVNITTAHHTTSTDVATLQIRLITIIPSITVLHVANSRDCVPFLASDKQYSLIRILQYFYESVAVCNPWLCCT